MLGRGRSSTLEDGGVPWADVLNTGPSSSSAPGPPTSYLLNKTSPSQSRKASKASPGGRGAEAPMAQSSLDELTEAARKGDIEGWNPMAFDYANKSFNSYVEGPGKLIQSRDEKDVITLFVDRIPTAITKEGLRNLFSAVGPVRRVSIVPTQSNRNTTYGFVEFSTVRDAEAAIQKYNNKDMGNNIRLVVKVSESKKHQEERKRELMEERQFSRSLRCAKNDTSFEQPESDEEAEKALSNPLQPKYISPSSSDNLGNKRSSNISYGGSVSNSTPTINKSKLKDKIEGSESSEKSCKVCQQPAVSRCSRCKTAYCSKKCQREDWPRHRNECTSTIVAKGNNSIEHSDSPPGFADCSEIRIADGSEDEGFEIHCPSSDDLKELKQVLHDTKTSEDLADLMASVNITNKHPECKSGISIIHKQFQEENFKDHDNEFPGKALIQSLIPSSPMSLNQSHSRESNIQVTLEECFVSIQSVYSQLQRFEKPLPSLPPLSFPPLQFQAVLTYVFSPCEFNVLIPSVEVKQALQFIRATGCTLQPGSISANQLTMGSKCGYKNDKGEFMRVSVCKVKSPAEIVVVSCDFGGRYSVPAKSLIHLPEELVLVPNLSRHCILKGVCITEHGKENLSGAITAFKALVRDQPVCIESLGVKDGSVVCAAMTSECDPNLIGSLLRSKYVMRTSSSEDENKQLPLRLSYSSSKVEYHHVEQESTVVILPTVVNSPCLIWATIDHPHLDKVAAMHKDMNHCYPPEDASLNPYVPAKGEICVAKYSQDQKYYRAEVLLVHHNGMADVRFVETGRIESLTVSQLYHIKPDFLTLPKQARRFCLSGVAPYQSLTWSDNAIAFIKSKILNRHVNVKVLTVDADKVLIEMFDPDLPNQLLNNSLILLGHAEVSQPKKSLKTVASPNLKGVNAFLTEVSLTEKANNFALPESNMADSSVIASEASPNSPRTPATQPSSCSSSNSEIMVAPDLFFLSEGDFVKVCLSHLVSLERFYVQLVEPSHLSKVESVLGKIQTTKLVNLPKKHIKKGTVCLCRYTEDNEVHRAQIICVMDQKVTVVFKDYGNVFHCTGDVLYKITEELLDLPFQSISCSLNQVKNPAGNKKDWDPAALTCFKKLLESGPLKAKVVKIVGALHVVELKLNSPQGVVDVLTVMIESGFVRSREIGSQKKNPISFQKKRSEVSDACETSNTTCPEMPSPRTKDPDTKFESTQSSVLTPSSFKPAQRAVIASLECDEEICQVFPPCSSLEKMNFNNAEQCHRVLITEIAALNEIYVQIVSNESMSAMNSVSQCLESLSVKNPQNSSKVQPPANSLCVAKYSQDSLWYRCKVESPDDNASTVRVQFIDYGNRDEVFLSDVVPCPKECLTVPVVAVKCSLATVPSMQIDNGRALKFLKKHINSSESSVIAEVISYEDNIPMVKIKVGEADVIQNMRDLNIIVDAKDLYPMITAIQKMALPTDLLKVKIIISEVVSPTEVYVQIASEEVKERLMAIGEGLNAVLKSEKSSLTHCPDVGSLCCARFSADNHWYRAVVRNDQGNTIVVQFVDYGNTETIVLGDVMACPKVFSSYPLIAIKCELSGLQSLQPVEAEKVIQYLKQHTADVFFTPEVTAKRGGVPSLTLRNEKGITLMDELLSQNVFKKVSIFIRDIPHVKLPEEEFKMLIAEVHNPSNFYIQVATVENAHILEEINKGLNNKEIPLGESFSSLPGIGTLCCARFSADKQWYRAEVITNEQDYCDVFFVDYGNFDKATLSDLAVCPSQLCSLPMQAIKCGLSGIPQQIDSDSNLIQYLQENLGGLLLDGKVESSVDQVPQISILKEGKNILEESISLKVLTQSNMPCKDDVNSSVHHVTVQDMDSVELPQTESFKALVTEVVNSAEIYIQLATSEVGHLEKRVSDALNTLDKRIVTSSPVVGSLYCAKFSSDEQWYRTEVKGIDQRDIKVFFIDYGGMDTVAQDSLAFCPEEITKLPQIASKVSLDGLPSTIASSESITAHLKNILLNNLVSVTITQVKGADVFVDIMTDGNPILNTLSSLGLLKTECFRYVKDMTNTVLPEAKQFKVLISSVVSHKKFYVQVASRSVGELLSSISELIGNACNTFKSFESAPEVGILCCAKFSDDEWYRAEVLEVVNKKAQVKSLDYGSIESVSTSNLAVCPDELYKLPCVAVECCLGKMPALEVSSSDLDTLLNRCTDIILSAEAVGVINNTTELVLMKDNMNILEEIVTETEVQESQHVPQKLEYITLPVSEEFQVLITEVVSPTEFYVQLATTEVGNLLKKVTDIVSNKEHKSCQSCPISGSLCCAKFSQDKQWYRAKVLSIDNTLCNVKFVDFGNTDSVFLSDLLECPLECRGLPLLACPCCLEGFPVDKEVSSGVVNAFKEHISTMSLLTAKVISYSNDVYELALANNGESLSSFINKTSHSSNSLPLVSSMAKIEIPSTSESFQVSITEITNLQEIYVQFATQHVAVMLNDISDGLQKHFSAKYSSLVHPPPLGSLCCAKYSKDSLWYRAEVRDIEDNNYVVHFLDYGNKDTLPLTSLAECPSQFIDFPILAVSCAVLDIPLALISSVDAALVYLREVSLDVETSLKIEDIVGGIPQVTLFWEGKNLVNLLNESGLVNSYCYIKANLPTLAFPSTSQCVQCLVYGVTSLSEFYVHVNNKERSSILNKIEELVGDMLAKNALKPSVVSPSAGDLCLAKFSADGKWYRAKVENVTEDICDILYLDYRNTDKVLISKIVPCPENIASLPQVAIRCGLHGLPSSLTSYSELLSTFKDMVSDSAVFEGKCMYNIGGIPQIELVKGNCNVLNLLGIVSSAPMYSNMHKLQLPTSGETFQLLVCELLNPSELYVQVNGEESISAIQKLNEKQNTLTDLTPLSSFPPIGSVCIAKFSQDGMWYRARVDSVTDNKCSVFFIDYGNYEVVTLSEMVACPADWLEIPTVAVTCSLHGIENITQDWSSSSCSILKTLTSERLLNASVVSSQIGGNTSVQLSDIINGKLISVEFRNMIQPTGSTENVLRKCQVTEVNHPGSLYFQYLESDNANNLSLLNKLQKVYSNPAGYAGFMPTVGSMCCAQFTEDKLWYRCKVLAISEDKVKLSYIDFGTVDFISKDNIYQLDDSFASHPPLAVHAKINGIGPSDSGVWTKGAINKLTELCDRVLFASVVHQDTDIACVELFEDEQRQSSIADILVSGEHACFVKN